MTSRFVDVSSSAQIISSMTLVRLIAPYVCINGKRRKICVVHLCKLSIAFRLYLDIFNITMMGPGKCSHLMKYFCVVMFHVASPDRPDPAQFQKINFVGSLMTGAIATARGKHTKSETSHLKTRSEQ